MKEGYRLLGDFIRQVDVRNTDGKEENLLGVSVQKMFIPSIANTVGTDFTKYKVVKRGSLATFQILLGVGTRLELLFSRIMTKDSSAISILSLKLKMKTNYCQNT